MPHDVRVFDHGDCSVADTLFFTVFLSSPCALLLLRSAVVELKFSSQKKQLRTAHVTRHAACARGADANTGGKATSAHKQLSFSNGSSCMPALLSTPSLPPLSFPMSSYWSKACSAQLNLTLLQLQRANYGCCMSSVSRIETACV